MQAHQLQPRHALKSRKRVGRGGKKGTYSGKGGKGQTARAGRKLVPIIRELIKRYPKLRGYRAFVPENTTAEVNFQVLEEKYDNDQVINPELLVKDGLVRTTYGKIPAIKILGKGKLTKKFTFENLEISGQAKEAVEKAGGIVNSEARWTRRDSRRLHPKLETNTKSKT